MSAERQECVTYRSPEHGDIPIWFTEETAEQLMKDMNEKLGGTFVIYRRPVKAEAAKTSS